VNFRLIGSVITVGMFAFAALTTSFLAPEAPTYMGVFMSGKKIGYVSVESANTTYQSKPATKTISKTRMKFGLIGSEVEMAIDSETISVNGKRVKMNFTNSSMGRKQVLEAWFEPKTIRVEIDNNGTKTKQSLDVPKDGIVVDDPVTEFVLGSLGGTKSFYILDSTTASLVKNSLQINGEKTITVQGKTVTAKEIEIIDPRLSTLVYVSGKGDVLKVTSSIGIEMIPMDEVTALSASGEGGSPDLANLTSIAPSPAITTPDRLTQLKIRLKSEKLPNVVSDGQQIAKKVGDAWEIDIRPKQLAGEKSVSIEQARQARPDWVKPSHLIPCNTQEFKKLARSIIGKKTDVRSSALAIRQWVNGRMGFNAGIGVLRDAAEILKTSEGVCRDYAILTATICRAAGIPTRLASGLVNFDGNFYYHAWVEVYTGFDWVPMDSVPSDPKFTATHVKLSQGNVDKAFQFTVLTKAQMTVLSAKG
jgi:hypothetical protein